MFSNKNAQTHDGNVWCVMEAQAEFNKICFNERHRASLCYSATGPIAKKKHVLTDIIGIITMTS